MMILKWQSFTLMWRQLANMCNFAKEDVLRLANAILEDPLIYMDGDYTPYYYCQYCDAELSGYSIKAGMFIHHLDCPVLIAQDILTDH